jgi:CheY-like chemotaxis protein
MPQIDGIEILRQIRADAKIAQTPVVFHTAGFNIQRREEAITLGALAWLFKGGPGGADIQMILKEIGRLYESVGGAKTITKQSSRGSKSTSRNPTDPD